MDSPAIDDLAALWAIRSETDLSPEQKAELEEWLASDARHLGAFVRAQAVALNSHRLSVVGEDVISQSKHELAQDRPSRRGLIAAALVLGMAGAGISSAVIRGGQAYRTGLGEVRDFTLVDGTVLTLSALSSVSVRFDDRIREIIMSEGEILLDVATDQRPFRILVAGSKISVSQGQVLLQRFAQDPLKIMSLDSGVSVQKPFGSALRINAREELHLDDEPETLPVDESAADRALAWKQGRLALYDETLGYAARAFSRFSPTPIVFDKPATAAMRLTGLFDLKDPVGFARAAALSLNLGVSVRDSEIRLLS